MDLSFDIMNSSGDHIMVALSYYDYETINVFSSDPQTLTLLFYDVTLIRKSGEGYVGAQVLFAISDILAKILKDNSNAVLCFYCDPDTDVRRNHKNMLPQEYRSRLFSRMFDRYVEARKISDLINHRVTIENPKNPTDRQFAHFICRKEHQKAVIALGQMLMQK